VNRIIYQAIAIAIIALPTVAHATKIIGNG
jgi:hypothetical protein